MGGKPLVITYLLKIIMDLHQYICKKFLVKVVRVVIIFLKLNHSKMTIKKLYEGCKELKQKWTVMI